MKKALPVAPPSLGSDSDGGADDASEEQKSIVIAPRIVSVTDNFRNDEISWLASSHIPADLIIQVEDVIFKVHKYPLISKCGYLRRLDFQPPIATSGHDMKLESLPGGSETFQVVIRFCYGLPVDLNPKNIAPLRCASEYLEMSEEMEDGNLMSKTEAFLTFVILSSSKDAVTVLKSCEDLSPWAENLQIVRRCCDSIAWKASRDLQSTGDLADEDSWWLDEVAKIRIDHFMRIVTAVRAKGTRPEIIGKYIMNYAEKCLPGIDAELQGPRGYGFGKNELQLRVIDRKNERSDVNHEKQRTLIESLISILPPQQEAVSCKFLLKMLKMAMVHSATPALIAELEKRIGMKFEDADVNDLLIPCYKYADQAKATNSPEKCTMHDIDVVQRIMEYFLMHEQQQQPSQKSGKPNVSKILDNYLAEIARDPNLSITKFQVLAQSLPENARTCDDGLYRAIDTYLKTHPTLSEHDRRRLCKIMNCGKLSLDACLHAAQNDRLPLRIVIQVLFSEQVKMRTAMQGKETVQSGNNSEQENNRPSTNAEIKTLRAELENVKSKMAELQNDYCELQREYEKLSNKPKSSSAWSLSWRKIKHSFHQRVDGDETLDAPQRDSRGQSRSRSSFRRRLSLS